MKTVSVPTPAPCDAQFAEVFARQGRSQPCAQVHLLRFFACGARRTGSCRVIGAGAVTCSDGGPGPFVWAVGGDARAMRCSLHDCPLESGWGEFDFPVFGEGYWDARSAEFPNANLYVDLRCMMPDRPEERIRVDYCPACRRAEEAWHAARGRGPG